MTSDEKPCKYAISTHKGFKYVALGIFAAQTSDINASPSYTMHDNHPHRHGPEPKKSLCEASSTRHPNIGDFPQLIKYPIDLGGAHQPGQARPTPHEKDFCVGGGAPRKRTTNLGPERSGARGLTRYRVDLVRPRPGPIPPRDCHLSSQLAITIARVFVSWSAPEPREMGVLREDLLSMIVR